MSLAPVFTLNINHKVIPGTVAVGKFDGVQACLTGATVAGKVFVHNPRIRGNTGSHLGRVSETTGDVTLLNINQTVTSLTTGCLDKPGDDSSKDVLMVGTPTNLLVYDVENNSDIFYKDAPDGVRSCLIGQMGGYDSPLALIGGNCSLIGFDKSGNDVFWSVTGDNVCSLALLDFTGSGDNELVVGSEDFDIRVFQQDEILYEITETEVFPYINNIVNKYVKRPLYIL